MPRKLVFRVFFLKVKKLRHVYAFKCMSSSFRDVGKFQEKFTKGRFFTNSKCVICVFLPVFVHGKLPCFSGFTI